MKPTKRQLEALATLKNSTHKKPMTAKQFARLFWPNSPMHTKTSNQGNGACTGKAAWLCGGGYLSKLSKKTGWVYWVSTGGVMPMQGYMISSAGLDVLHSDHPTTTEEIP